MYSFQTATGMLLKNDVNPMMFRRIAQEAGKISASVDECGLLRDLYGKSEVSYQKELRSIIQKLGCDMNAIDATLTESDEGQMPEMNASQQQYRNISVFATIGWILFFIAFTLKIHYLLAYLKHKRLNEA
jgi:hypothetical protein